MPKPKLLAAMSYGCKPEQSRVAPFAPSHEARTAGGWVGPMLIEGRKPLGQPSQLRLNPQSAARVFCVQARFILSDQDMNRPTGSQQPIQRFRRLPILDTGK